MNSGRVLPPELLVAPRNAWDRAVEWTLGAMLVVMPLALGAVEAWSELIVIVLAAILSLIVAARAAVDRTFRPPWTFAYVPLLAWIVLAVLQLMPLPPSLVGALSPGAIAVRTELMAGDEAWDGGTTTISMYPLATAHGLQMALVGASVFVATASVFRTAPQIKRLLMIVFVIGCAEAALALLQIFTQTDRMFWIFDAGSQRMTSGSFINYSNFSQFMNLSLGAGLALLLVRLEEDRGANRWTAGAGRPFGGAQFGEHGWYVLGLVLCVLAVFTSMSRNGVISMVIAGAIVGVGLYARGTLQHKGWLLAILPVGAAAGLLLFAFDQVYDRMATLEDGRGLADRWQLTLGVLQAWRAFPVWGAGLGVHEFVFPLFDNAPSRQLAGHADNDYAQLMEETGMLGAACIVGFAAVVLRNLLQICRRGRSRISIAAFGLAFGLIAVAIHSATDFGQHVPAVFSLSAVTCGLIIQLTKIEREATSRSRRRVAPELMAWSRGSAIVAVAPVAMLAVWTITRGYSSFVADQWWAMAYQVERQIDLARGEAAPEEYADLLAASERAAEAQPGNIEYQYWLAARRWRALNEASSEPPTDGAYSSEARQFAGQIADHLTRVRRICPTFGPPHALEGQLRLFVLGDSRGSRLISQGVRLAPYDPATCLTAGIVAAKEGRAAEAVQLLKRATQLDGSMFSQAAAVMIGPLKNPEAAVQLAGVDFHRISQLAEIFGDDPQHAHLLEDMSAQATRSLRERAAADQASAVELANLARIENSTGDAQAAVALFRRALAVEYQEVDWRIELARALAALGRIDEARHEAKICIRLRPGYRPARKLVEDLD